MPRKPTTPPVDWTVEGRIAELRRLYLVEAMTAKQMAPALSKAFGVTVTERMVTRQAFVLQLSKDLTAEEMKARQRRNQALGVAGREARLRAAGKFVWNDEREATLTASYRDCDTAEQTALKIGDGCTVIMVRKRIARLGLNKTRDPRVAAELKRLASRRGADATRAKFAEIRANRPEPEPRERRRRTAAPVSRHVEPDMRKLIDAAIAEGKVTVLPSGSAAGLSRLEQHLWTAPAGDSDWRKVHAQNRKAHFASRRRAGSA